MRTELRITDLFMRFNLTNHLFLFPILTLFFNCSGLNLRTYPIPIAPDTNPVPNYSGLSVVRYGGFLWHQMETPVGLTPGVKLSKRGESCSHSILFLFAWGDSSIEMAKINGSVVQIGLMEYINSAILGGIYHKHCLVLLGQ